MVVHARRALPSLLSPIPSGRSELCEPRRNRLFTRKRERQRKVFEIEVLATLELDHADVLSHAASFFPQPFFARLTVD